MNQINHIKESHVDNIDMIFKIFQKGLFWGSKEIYIVFISEGVGSTAEFFFLGFNPF